MKKNPEMSDELRPEYDMKKLLKDAVRVSQIPAGR
jgi:hypothetical protein